MVGSIHPRIHPSIYKCGRPPTRRYRTPVSAARQDFGVAVPVRRAHARTNDAERAVMGTAASRRRRTEETVRMSMELAASRRRAAGPAPSTAAARWKQQGRESRRLRPDPTGQQRGRHMEAKGDNMVKKARSRAEAAPRLLGSRDFLVEPAKDRQGRKATHPATSLTPPTPRPSSTPTVQRSQLASPLTSLAPSPGTDGRRCSAKSASRAIS